MDSVDAAAAAAADVHVVIRTLMIDCQSPPVAAISALFNAYSVEWTLCSLIFMKSPVVGTVSGCVRAAEAGCANDDANDGLCMSSVWHSLTIYVVVSTSVKSRDTESETRDSCLSRVF